MHYTNASSLLKKTKQKLYTTFWENRSKTRVFWEFFGFQLKNQKIQEFLFEIFVFICMPAMLASHWNHQFVCISSHCTIFTQICKNKLFPGFWDSNFEISSRGRPKILEESLSKIVAWQKVPNSPWMRPVSRTQSLEQSPLPVQKPYSRFFAVIYIP